MTISRPQLFKQLSLLCIAAFIIRASFFFFYVQHNERYHQADSNDYHNAALAMALGKGMYQFQSGQPIFWRTPGYPAYLAPFYKLFGIKSGNFPDNAAAHKASIWLQIILNSLIPILLFLLALSLTRSLKIAWITAFISVFHLGLILSSTFLLTEGIAVIFFYLFFLLFFNSFSCYGEPPFNRRWMIPLLFAALSLAVAAWIRPMAQFVGVVCLLLLLFFCQESFKIRLKKVVLFALIFIGGIFPWYYRNYQLTGHWFFCPMFGTYLNAFVAPKILRKVQQVPLEKTWAQLQQIAHQQAIVNYQLARKLGKFVVPDYACGQISWPIVLQYPGIAFSVWMPEVFKTAFDLYASQLVAFASNSFMWDPLEEFLGQKIALALYKQPMPFWMRLLCWLDFLYTLALWLSLFIGFWLFLLRPLIKRFNVNPEVKQLSALWFKLGIIIASFIFMTGGFGYARLRLPIEPLMIILALTVWVRRPQHSPVRPE